MGVVESDDVHSILDTDEYTVWTLYYWANLNIMGYKIAVIYLLALPWTFFTWVLRLEFCENLESHIKHVCFFISK